MGMSAPLPERVYCAGPFSPLEWSSQEQNIARALQQAAQVRALGFVPVLPHVAVFPPIEYEPAMQECFSHLDTCHIFLLMEDWTFSPGTLREKPRAESRGLLVVEGVEALAAAKTDGLPLTLGQLVHALWYNLARIIEKETRAGMAAPAFLPGLWNRRFGLFECWLNGHAEPATDRTTGAAIPPGGLLVDDAGQFLAIVSQGPTALREGCTDRFRHFVKVVQHEADLAGAGIQ